MQPPESSQPVQASSDVPVQVQQIPPSSGPSPLPQQLQQMANTSNSPLPTMAQAQPQFPPGVKAPQSEQTSATALTPSHQQTQPIGGQRPSSTSQQLSSQQRSSAPNAFPGSLSDLVVSFESVKQKGTFYHYCFSSSQNT